MRNNTVTAIGIVTALFRPKVGGMMKILKKKTRKALEKTLRKAIKKHAPAIAAGLATGIASSLATLAGTEASEGRGRSNLGKIAEKVKAAIGGEEDPTPKGRVEKKTARQNDPPSPPTQRTM